MPIVDLLSQPVWQGIGALVAVAALMLYAWFEVRRRRQRSQQYAETDNPIIRYFALVDSGSERAFYDHLISCIDKVTETIYRTGHGFHHERRAPFFTDLLAAEERALERGVEFIRVQTGTRLARSFASRYAEMLARHRNFKIVAEFDKLPFSDLGLLDPHGHHPVTYFLFESREPASSGMLTRPTTAVFISDARSLASGLARQFIDRVGSLETLMPQDMRDLSKSYVYFGWGVHMAKRKMQQDISDAIPLGTAILRGWKRDVSAMLAGPADRATIQETGDENDAFDGVAYELSWWAKTRLDRLEGRAYESVPVTIELKGVPMEAFTYLPLPASTSGQPLSPDSWIDLVIEGAVENQMKRLLRELRAAGAPLPPHREEIL